MLDAGEIRDSKREEGRGKGEGLESRTKREKENKEVSPSGLSNVLLRYYKLVDSLPFLLEITMMEHVDTAG